MSKAGRYFWNIFISVDQFFNTVLGGDPDETVSSRVGKCKARHGGKIPWSHPFARVLDKALDMIDPGHSVDAIDNGEGSDAVFGTCEQIECKQCRTVHPSPSREHFQNGEEKIFLCPVCGNYTWHVCHTEKRKGGLSKRKDKSSCLSSVLK